jgi:hypothetical protein
VFPLDFDADFVRTVGATPWALLACASFEERCAHVARRTTGPYPPACSILLHPLDAGDHQEWALECTRKQDAYRAELAQLLSPVVERNVDLFDPDLVDECAAIATETLSAMAAVGATTLVVDMSSMPKALLFPLAAVLLDSQSLSRLLLTYCEPERYNTGALQADPDTPAGPMPGFNYLGGNRLLAWIPLLGFGSFFTGYVHDAIGQAGRLDRRVFPLVGFPGYEPHFFDRMIFESGRRLLTSWAQTGDRFLYAPAWDPFATKDVIDRAINELSAPDVSWVGSPLGPRPMALGMMLAARAHRMTLITCQARSYHPNYSFGVKRTHVYPLKGL